VQRFAAENASKQKNSFFPLPGEHEYGAPRTGGQAMTHPVAASFARRSSEVAEWLAKNSWVGWAAWIVFCVSILVQTGPKRFGSTFSVYLDFANRLWSRQPLYDPTTLDGFNYWPSSLLIYIPVLKLDPVVAGWIMITFAMECLAGPA
jgi:hypothetical protein